MAKVNGPLLSFGARGSIGDTVVFANWKGIDYARQYVKPANPQTTAQLANRTRFAFLREMYKLAPSTVRLPWQAFAQGRPFTDFNKFVGENNRLLNGESDLQAMIMSPGAKGGLPPVAVAASTGSSSGEIDVDVTKPDQLPDGWSITGIAAAAAIDQDPTGIFTGPYIAGSQVDPDTTLTLTGMDAAEDCVVCAWITYEKPDGETAYSVSLLDTATSGA
jgi:hypothetical protein